MYCGISVAHYREIGMCFCVFHVNNSVSASIKKDDFYGKVVSLFFASSSFVFILLTGVDFKIKTVELRGKKIRLQIW